MRSGQPVSIRIDAYPDHKFTARVDSVQAGTGSAFSLLPAENASCNYVTVVQRVPVKLVFDPLPPAALYLAPGLSVVPALDIHDANGEPSSHEAGRIGGRKTPSVPSRYPKYETM